jgi:hypothetical protein
LRAAIASSAACRATTRREIAGSCQPDKEESQRIATRCSPGRQLEPRALT